jgi:uncharacterized protein
VRSGRGFLGVHSATDTFYSWPDYLDLIGGYFNDHPWHQPVTIEVVDPGDPVVAFLGKSLQIEDEIYQISDFDYRGSHVLLRLDQSSVDLRKSGVHQRFYGWPLAWTRFFGQGRVFYTALGHEASVWQDPATSKSYQRYSLVYAKVALGGEIPRSCGAGAAGPSLSGHTMTRRAASADALRDGVTAMSGS